MTALDQAQAAASTMEEDVRRFAGFDLGHGESAISIAGSSGRIGASPLPIGEGGVRAVPTAAAAASAEVADADIVVGRAAITRPGLANRWAAFKQSDVSAAPMRLGTELFVRGLVHHLRARGSIDEDVGWVVGHPSGWSRDEVDAYADLLERALRTRPTMLPEAQAAFLPMKARGELTARDLKGELLIIDIGSSTTDFAIIRGVEAIDLGNPDGVQLGAGLLDLALYHLALQQLDDERRDLIAEFLDHHPEVGAQVLFSFRDAKERFFNDEENLRLGGTGTLVDLDFIEPALGFEWKVRVTADLVDRSIDTPLPRLGVTADLFKTPTRVELSWRGELVRHLEYALGRSPGVPRKVLVTGGASKMSWVLDAVAEVCTDSRVVRTADPESAVADGLALHGAASWRIAGFLDDVHEYTTSDRISDILNESYPELASDIASVYANGAAAAFILPAFLAWRDGMIATLNDVAGFAARRIEVWAAGEGRERLDDAVQAWFSEELAPTVNGDVKELTRPYPDIPQDALALPLSARSLGDGHTVGLTAGGTEAVVLGAFDGLAAVVALLIGAVVGSILFGGGVALLATTGPLGPVLAGVAAVGTMLAGSDPLKTRVSSSNLPLGLRRRMVTEAGVRRKVANKASQIEADMRASIEASLKADEVQDRLVHDIARQMELALAHRAQIASAHLLK
jgi:hypothetical protein